MSVAMITYNHRPFIAQAIESVLAQHCDFAFELVIGEDYSTDGTREICLAYASQYPRTIRLLPSDGNLGMQRNFSRVLEACSGDYIALLEGDDYWTDPGKLRKQAEILDANREYSFCAHNASAYDEVAHVPYNPHQFMEDTDITVSALINQPMVTTCTLTMRRGCIQIPLPVWVAKVTFVDYSLHLLLASRKPGIGINEAMAHYRVHGGGVTHGRDPLFFVREIARVLLYFNEFTGFKYDTEIRASLYRQAESVALSCRRAGHYGSAMISFVALPRFRQGLGKLLVSLYKVLTGDTEISTWHDVVDHFMTTRRTKLR